MDVLFEWSQERSSGGLFVENTQCLSAVVERYQIALVYITVSGAYTIVEGKSIGDKI